jgi:uncharacterized protein (DUF1330 family)
VEISDSASVFTVIEVKIKNHEKFFEYLRSALPTMNSYGGNLVSAYEVQDRVAGEVGGMWQITVTHEWPSRERFMEWLNSPEYKPLRLIRPQTADVDISFVKKLL